jgi:putative OPT family oligopeptide transporter
LPAFVLSRAWPSFGFGDAYWKSTALILVGSVLGVLFVSLVRRILVEDPELPFPESVAASQIHKAGQAGSQAAKYLFYNMGFGALTFLLGAFNLFSPDKDFVFPVGQLGKSTLALGRSGTNQILTAGGVSTVSAPTVSPAFFGVGYVIGPELASLNFSGSVIAWGLLIPLLIFFLGPQLKDYLPADATKAEAGWLDLSNAVWRYIVRPIAIGAMMMGTGYTLFRMRKSLMGGLAKAFEEVRKGAPPMESLARTERYMSFRTVIGLLALTFVAMTALYIYLSKLLIGGIAAAVIMLIVGFFFATVSGYLVGLIGSSNNPVSGLTLSTLVIAALMMVVLGATGMPGVIAVLGVASVVCVSSSVAGELLQDFKVGYILGGTPRYIQIAELIAVVVASLVMYFPLMILHQGNINAGGIGFGDKNLSAPQAGLMASLAQGIVGGNMAWPLVIAGMAMGAALIMVKVKSPMLVAIGMYLPISITSAIFVGGLIRWYADSRARKAGLNEAQKARMENVGVLAASGMIAGEALAGIVTAVFYWRSWPIPQIFAHPTYLVGVMFMAVIAFILIQVPLKNAGDPNEPAPPVAIM